LNNYNLRHFWKKKFILDWILIPLIVIFGYLSISNIGLQSNYYSLYLNLATSFLIVWLSVRLIDNLIEKRKNLNKQRYELINEIHNLITLFENTTTNSSDVLQNRNYRTLKYFKYKFTQKTKYFDYQENDSFLKIINKLENTIRIFDNLEIARKSMNDEMDNSYSDVEFRKRIDSLNTELSDIFYQIADEFNLLTAHIFEKTNFSRE